MSQEHSRQSATVFVRGESSFQMGDGRRASWWRYRRAVKGGKVWVGQAVRQYRGGKMALGEAQKWEKQRSSCPPNLPPLREQNSAFLAILCTGSLGRWPSATLGSPTSQHIPLTAILLSSASQRDGATRCLDRKKNTEDLVYMS